MSDWKEALQYLAWCVICALTFPVVAILGLWLMAQMARILL